MKKRATDIEKSNRLFTIQGWLLDGVSDRLIVKQTIQQWGLSKRQSERYIREAYIDWQKIEGVTLDMKREMKIAELQQRKRNMDARFKTTPEGIRVLNEIDKIIIRLDGIEPTKRIEVQTSVKPIEFTIIKNKE